MKKVSQIFVVAILSLFMIYNLPISVFATEEEDTRDIEVTIENEISYSVDTRYKTPFKSYPTLTENVPGYDAVTRELLENRYIYGDMDFCTIKEVYVDGWCLVEISSLEVQFPFSIYRRRTSIRELASFKKNGYIPLVHRK